MGQYLADVPQGLIWFFVIVGYFAFSWFVGNLAVGMLKPLWREATAKEKKIELVSAAAAVLAFLLATASFFYTVRQVDGVSDRLVSLEKAVEALKAKSGGEPKPEPPKLGGAKTGNVQTEAR